MVLHLEGMTNSLHATETTKIEHKPDTDPWNETTKTTA